MHLTTGYNITNYCYKEKIIITPTKVVTLLAHLYKNQAAQGETSAVKADSPK